jgi:Domain of unknown function (DUF222)
MSVPRRKVAHMFDELRKADDATVAAAITAGTREESAASARRLAAVAELADRRSTSPEAADRARWACDTWDSTAAEVSAALGCTQGVADGQMRLALALRHRLPRVGALLADGSITYWLARTIVMRTDLVGDNEAITLVDKALAEDITTWGPLSLKRTEEAIDFWIDRHDPAAIRRTRAAGRGRDIVIGTPDDAIGTTSLWGAMLSTDAAVLDRRLIELARSVCADDPRTIAQRRADALGALAAGATALACQCGTEKCPVAGDTPRSSNVVIHIVADAAAVGATCDPTISGEFAHRPITPETTLAETLAPDPDLVAPRNGPSAAALIAGGGVIPTPLLAQLIRDGAKVRHLHHPGDSAPEPQYRPSTALDEYVRLRDLTCRFPSCDCPAVYCDVDHTIAYDDGGPTHACNLKCLCRKHHLLKTFWTAWQDEQRPDGSVRWTAPNGQTYTTNPGSRILFPALCIPTSGLVLPDVSPREATNRETAMTDFRRRTRAQQRATRIKAERALNDAHVAEVEESPPF